MKHTSLDSLIESLRPLLPNYLTLQGFNTSKNFSCITGTHKDAHASMTCKKYPARARCFSCQATADIFQAAHFLEGKPIKGSDFIYENVFYLADKLGITYSLAPPTEIDIKKKRVLQAYEAISDALSSSAPPDGFSDNFNSFLSSRNLDLVHLNSNQIGIITLEQVHNLLVQLGLDDIEQEAGLTDKLLFGANRLTFSLLDNKRRVVSFISRALDDSEPRYYHMPSTSELRNQITSYSSVLYGEHLLDNKPSKVLIVEGHTDALALWLEGEKEVVAIGGLALRASQLNRLKAAGKYIITLCVDNDQAGLNFLKHRVESEDDLFEGFDVSVKQLYDAKDPEEFIRKFGLEAFRAIKEVSWLDFCISTLASSGYTAEQVSNVLLSRIAKAGKISTIRAYQQAKQLALATSLPYEAVLADLKIQIKKLNESSTEKIKNLVQETISSLKENPTTAAETLSLALSKLERVQTRDIDESPEHTFVRFLDQAKAEQESKDPFFEGYKFHPNGLGALETVLAGPWKEGKFLVIGGKENVGKSALCTQLGFEVASIPENNAVFIHWTIDDSATEVIPRYICLASGQMNLEMNHISNPHYYAKVLENQYLVQHRDMAFNKVRKLALDGKIIVRDQRHGKSLNYIKHLIQETRSRYPDRKILVCIDNLHNVTDWNWLDMTSKMSNVSKAAKDICTEEQVSLICTVEYRKIAAYQIPSNDDLADSRALKYDSNVIFHLYNDMHERGVDKALILNEDEEVPKPRVLFRVGKNKICSFKGEFYMNLHPAQSRFEWVDPIKALKDKQKRAESIKGSSPGISTKSSFIIPSEGSGDDLLI